MENARDYKMQDLDRTMKDDLRMDETVIMHKKCRCGMSLTRAVLSQENRAKPCKFRYEKPMGNFIHKI